MTSNTIEATSDPMVAAPSSGALRMRRHRDRRKRSCRCTTIELRESEIDALMRLRLLAPGERHNNAVRKAVYTPSTAYPCLVTRDGAPA